MAPLSRFADTAANDGALTLLSSTDLPIAAKTMAASGLAAASRVVLLPLDTWETMKQVRGRDGLTHLIARTRSNPFSLWQGTVGVVGATSVAHFSWFYTHNKLCEKLEMQRRGPRRHLWNAAIGVASAVACDICANSLYVLKTIRQTSPQQITYTSAAKQVIHQEGLVGLFGRGLRTKVAASCVQSALFTVGWKAFTEFLENRSRDGHYNSV